MLAETDGRLLWKFVHNFGWKGMRAVQRFERRLKRGESFPAFLFISVTNACNLSCQGCWVTPSRPPRELAPETIHGIIEECNSRGSFVFGILGGEPLMYRGLFEVLERHPDCYFIVFTNGTLITDELAARMRKLGNMTPLISIEGLEKVSDERRGGERVYDRTLHGLELCRKHRLITGVATSVCRSNIDDLASESFINEMVKRGVHYLWYYIYRPAGLDPSPELALSREQVLALRRFIVDTRSKAPIIIVDAYWDHEGRALCPAATGISHHIGPQGDIEPCPPIQFAADNVGDGRNLGKTLCGSKFLAAFRSMASAATRGCILLERPEELRRFVAGHGARDTSGRGTGIDELARMKVCSSHHIPGEEIPERHWLYRFAKRHWFFGFGAYG